MASCPRSWHPELRHREALLAHSDASRELAYSLARDGWQVNELWLMICRAPAVEAPATTLPIAGQNLRRLKGRLGVEQGLPPASIEQFDHYDDMRAQAAARLAFAGYEDGTPMALADMYLRGDIAVIEDVATLRRGRGRGHARAAVLGATTQALRVSARAVYLYAAPEIAQGPLRAAGLRADRRRLGVPEAPAGRGHQAGNPLDPAAVRVARRLFDCVEIAILPAAARRGRVRTGRRAALVPRR